MGVENGKEKRSVEAALSEELDQLQRCLAVTVKQNNWPRIACMWQKFYPSWAHPAGLKGGRFMLSATQPPFHGI